MVPVAGRVAALQVVVGVLEGGEPGVEVVAVGGVEVVAVGGDGGAAVAVGRDDDVAVVALVVGDDGRGWGRAQRGPSSSPRVAVGAGSRGEKVIGSDCRPRSTIRSLHSGEPASSMWSSRFEQGTQRHLGLHAGQVVAQAVVDTGAELQVLAGVGPVDAQPVGVGSELVGVAVGAGHAQVEHGTGRHHLARQLDGFEGDASHELVGSVEAQQLVDGVGQPPGLFAQRGQLVGLVEQVEQAVADQGGGGLVPGHVQGDELSQQLLGGEAVPLVGGLHQRGHDVVARLGALQLDLIGQVRRHLVHQRQAGVALGGADHRVERAGHGRGPGAELR